MGVALGWLKIGLRFYKITEHIFMIIFNRPMLSKNPTIPIFADDVSNMGKGKCHMAL
jgi:hypothetical protein